MNIIINIDENLIENQQPKIYDLGSVVTTIQDLLDNSTITITNYRTIILQFIDLDLSVKYCFLNLDDYTKGDQYGLGQNILESDLIYFSSGGATGDFIPLSGTEMGFLITGDLEFSTDLSGGKRLFSDNEDYNSSVLINTNFCVIEANDNILSNYSGLLINSDGSIFVNTQIGGLPAKGISGGVDYSSNITDLDYVQKIYVDAQKPYKVYTALLSQTGTNAPTVATPLENTTGGTITFAYNVPGDYVGTCIGFTIPEGKFVPVPYISNPDDLVISLERLTDTTFRITTTQISNRAAVNNLVYGVQPLSFKVYN